MALQACVISFAVDLLTPVVMRCRFMLFVCQMKPSVSPLENSKLTGCARKMRSLFRGLKSVCVCVGGCGRPSVCPRARAHEHAVAHARVTWITVLLDRRRRGFLEPVSREHSMRGLPSQPEVNEAIRSKAEAIANIGPEATVLSGTKGARLKI